MFPSSVQRLVLVSGLLVSVLSGCGLFQQPKQPESIDDPWKDLPVVSTDGSGTIDENGGAIKLEGKDIELQIPRGSLPSGQKITIVLEEVDFNPNLAGIRRFGTLNKISYSPKAIKISAKTDDNIDVMTRLVLGPDSTQARFILDAVNSSNVVDSLWFENSQSHVAPMYIKDRKIVIETEIPAALAGYDMIGAARLVPKSYLRNVLCGSGYVDVKVFPATPDGYLCRPPDPNEVWDRANLQVIRAQYNWPVKLNFTGNATGLIRLLTANVGNIVQKEFTYKLSSDVVAQTIYNNIKLLNPDIVFLQELYDGSTQLEFLLPEGYSWACPSYPSKNRYECIAWQTGKFRRIGNANYIVGDKTKGEWAIAKSAESFSKDYCTKSGGKDSGGVWVTLAGSGIPSFKAMSVHTATMDVENPYCREEQLLAFLQKLDLATCSTCGNNKSLKDRQWSVNKTTRAILAGDFNVDPMRGGAPRKIYTPFKTVTDMERFKWMVDWSLPLGSALAPGKVEGPISPDDLNALVALRGENEVTTSYYAANKSFDHVLVTSKLVDESACVVLDGSNGHYALSEDWWNSPGKPYGMDHKAVACTLVITKPGFKLDLKPNSISINRGAEAKIILTITPQSGFTGMVNLSLAKQDGSSAPDGIRLSPVSVNVAGDGPVSEQITISVANSVAEGIYNLQVAGTGDNASASASLVLKVEPTNRDEIHWSWRSGPLNDIAYGNGFFVAVGDGVVLTSSDGKNWRVSNLKPANGLRLLGVTYGNGIFVAVGEGSTVFTSSNGIDWMPQDTGVAPWNIFSDVTYGGGVFVAVGYGGIVLTSEDGISWTKIDSGIKSDLYDVTFGNGIFVAVGTDGPVSTTASHRAELFEPTSPTDGGGSPPRLEATILISSDGHNWTRQRSGVAGVLCGVAYYNGTFVAVGSEGTVLTSVDGESWAKSISGTGYELQSVAYGNETFVAVGGEGTILTSFDGVNWALRDSEAQDQLQGVVYGNGIFLVVGFGGTILTSPDGISWMRMRGSTGDFLADVTHGADSFVAVGGEGTILTSSDGMGWAVQSSGTFAYLWDVAYGNGTFVAVGDTGAILTSSDGVSWTAQDSGTGHTLYGVAYGAGIFVAVGLDGTILTSSDGANWIQRGVGSGDFLYGVAYGAGTFVAVGGDGTILTSSDGANWIQRGVGSGDFLYGVAYGAGTFVAVGGDGTILTSSDGANWVDRSLSDTRHLLGATFGNGMFVIVGQGGATFTSPDGVNWTSQASGTRAWLEGVAYGNGTFVAVGAGGTILTSP